MTNPTDAVTAPPAPPPPATARARPPPRWPTPPARRCAGSSGATTPTSATASSRRSRRSSPTGPGSSSCSAPAGASRRSTSSRPRCAAPRAPGPTVIISPAARADARPDRGGRAGRHPRRDDELRQRPGLGRRARGARGGRRRRAARQPRAAQQPAVPRRAAARPRRAAAACSSSTRRTASATGATTSGPTTAASATCWPGCRPTPRCSRRPPPPTPGWSPTSSSSSRWAAARCSPCAAALARDSLRLGRAALPMSPEQRLGWLVAHLDELPGSGIVYTLTVSAAEDVAAALSDAGLDGRVLHRAHRPRRPRAARGGAAPQRGQGARRHLGAGDGLRQARPRLRRAPRRAELAGRLLPAGRPCRSRHRARRRAAAARPRGQGHLGATSPRCRCRARSRPMPCSAPSPRRGGRCRPRPSRPPSTCGAPGSSCCSRCSTSTVRCSACPGGWVSTGVPWTYDARALRPGRRRPGRPSSSSMVDYERTDACRMALPPGVPRRRDRRAVRPLRRVRRARGTPTERARPASSAPPASGCARAGVDLDPRVAVAHRHGPPRRAGQGQDRRRGGAAAGPRPGPAVRPRLGPAAARAAARRTRPAAPSCVRGLRAGARRVGLGPAPGRRRRDAVAVAARARRLARRGPRRGRPAPAARRRSTSRTAGPPASRAATARSGSPGCGSGSWSGPTSRPGWRGSTARCCSSTTSCRRGGPSPWPAGRCARPARRACCRSRSPSTAERPGRARARSARLR